MANRRYSLKKPRSDSRWPAALRTLCFGLLLAFAARATELKQDTIQAFDQYVRVTEEEREQQKCANPPHFSGSTARRSRYVSNSARN